MSIAVVAGTATAAVVYINKQAWTHARTHTRARAHTHTHTHTQNVPQWVGQNFRSMFWKVIWIKKLPI